MARSSSNRSRHARLHGVLEPDHAEDAGRLAVHAIHHDERGGAVAGDAVHDRRRARWGPLPPSSSTMRRTESAAPLRTERPSRKSMPLMRVWAVNGTSTASGASGSTRPYRSIGERRRSSALRASRRPGSTAWPPRPARAPSTPRHRDELGGLAVAEGDGAGLVEQQGVDVAGGLDGPAAHGQHVALHEAVHAGDADGRQQRADGGRDEAHQQGDEHDDRLLGPRVDGEGLQRHHRQQEDDREPGQQDVEGDLVRRLLPVGPLDEGDHPVEERLARLRGDAHDDLVGQHPGAAGDGRAVAAGLADDRRRLAGDGRLVDRGDALDDVAVAGDDLAGRRPRTGRRAASCVDGHLDDRCRRAGGRWPRSRPGSCAAWRPGPCPGPRPWPRRSWRTAR